MSISVCMIVKNEEKWLENCLSNVKNLADEIIVVDTGSQDRTKEIAGKFTDKIFDFAWIDDFSAARNFALEKATGGWILSLDADEIISEKDIEKIKKILENPEADAYHLIWRDYSNDTGITGWKSSAGDSYPESKAASGYSEAPVLRLFRNSKEHRFEGKIHETIQNSIKRNNGKIFMSDVVIHHYGNLRNKEEISEKKETYSRMLNEEMSNGEKDKFYLLFEIARELVAKNEIDKAEEALEESISINPEYAKSLAMLGAINIMKRNFDEAENLLKRAVILEPNDFSIHSNLGIIYSEKGEYLKAIRKLERAIEINNKSADSFFNLGIVYLKMGKQEKAMHFFEKAIELNPAYRERIRFG